MVFFSTRHLLTVFVAFACLVVGKIATAAETYDLRPMLEPNSVSRVELMLQVGGDALLMAEGKKTTLPISVVANISYDEKLLPVMTSAEGSARSLRYYDEAKVVIKVDKGGQKPALRDDRRLIEVDAQADKVTLMSPAGSLSRDELDLLEVPANSLIVDRLLPTEPVAIGATWSHSETVLTALLGLDAASSAEVSSHLQDVSGGVAKITLDGTLRGAIAGIGTNIELKAKYTYDLKSKRINWFALLVKEQRAIGHVGPGLNVVAKLIMKVTPSSGSVHLGPEAVASRMPVEKLALLQYEAPGETFGFDYDRRWYITSDEKNVVIMRLVDKGELVAQCNISPGATVQKQLTLAEFQQEIQNSLGKEFGQFVQAGEDTHKQGFHMLRVVATGKASDLPIHWIYYLLMDPDGQRASLVFTMESSLVERFGTADRELIDAMHFNPRIPKTATQAQPVR